MAALIEWNDDLLLQQPQIDDTHREFVALMRRTQGALPGPQAQWLRLYDELLAHTVEHFAQEEAWMAGMGFDPENCHARQHAAVLQALREVRERMAQAPDAVLVGQLLDELNQWFSMHARSMDAALAETMQRTGYDPASGRCEAPLGADAPGRHTCGSGSCA